MERLDEVDQLDALKELANTYRSLRHWDRVEQFACEMGCKAKLQYDLKEQSNRKIAESSKTTSRLFFLYRIQQFTSCQCV